MAATPSTTAAAAARHVAKAGATRPWSDRLDGWLRRAARRALRPVLPLTVRAQWAAARELAAREQLATPIAPPSGQRLAVLAPHADDETFGCGGTLAAAAARGCTVQVFVLTDGRHGYTDAALADHSAAGRAAFEQALVTRRQQEAAQASAALGLLPPRFLHAHDGALAADAAVGAQLAAALREFAPQAVFVPHWGDPHPDHHAAALLLLHAAAAAGLPASLRCWGYEVWAPLVANAYVDISAQWPLKSAAMQHYRSQLDDVDYPRVVAGLNSYRALGTGRSRDGYAEAFFVDTLAQWLALFGKLGDPR